ncbi:MAG: sodium:proton antiporter [Candidatus Aminicenantes bacterium]|nr:MAG: sodium:proton antiporter [Candidatus Aminicenantes bacterium]RLE03972.1 MAG: sodium:proton antiporter [Candidatus Aminicenantes bacterium]HHF43576.1 sodium:proton antiporter [Candidatus Aminicenantes bacterium]
MKEAENNPIVSLIASIVSPFIMLFGLYVIFHGHYSPGGGFQGGTLMAASIILIRLAHSGQTGQLQFPATLNTPLGSLGVLIYYGTGLAALWWGGQFLNYAYLPLAQAISWRRSWGILMVEIGVGLAVMAILVSIFDDLLEDNSYD